MKEARVFIPQRRYIACPACGKGEHLIEHLIIPHQVQKWGDWVCKECGAYFAGETYSDGQTMVEVKPNVAKRTRTLIRLRDNTLPLYFEIESIRYGTHDARYHYEEHSCVRNFLHDIVETWSNGKSDQHGIFEFIEERTDPNDSPNDSNPPKEHKRAFSEGDIARFENERQRAKEHEELSNRERRAFFENDPDTK